MIKNKVWLPINFWSLNFLKEKEKKLLLDKKIVYFLPSNFLRAAILNFWRHWQMSPP